MHVPVWFIVGFVALLAVLAFLLLLRKKWMDSLELQAQLKREFAALQQEKKVIYDFLHDLGEAFTEEIDREHLLRIIVTCARKVTGAKGAAIYLWDADREKLLAAIVSGTFPPVLKIDNIVADQLASRPESLEAFLRLEAIPADSTSVIGEVAHSGKAVFAERTELDDRFPWFRQKNLQTETYLAVPLHYRQEKLGVLALANQEQQGKTFTKADFDLVQSVADQASYSLQHAQVYNQLTEKKKLDHDIEVAREVQRILLPSKAPRGGRVQLRRAQHSRPASQRRLLRFRPGRRQPLGRGGGRCQRQGRPGLDHHGDVPQRVAQQGAGKFVTGPGPAGGKPPALPPTSARTCSSP